MNGNRRRALVRAAAACLLVCVLACGRREAPEGQGGAAMSVFVSIPPQADFARRLAGDRVAVHVMVPPGRSPHVYDPTPRQMARLAESRVYFCIGVPFEKRLIERIASINPRLRVVDTCKGVEYLPMEAEHRHEGEEEHAEEHNDAHAHEGERDPHVWLDPRRVKIIGRNMADALRELDPANAAQYGRNLARFEADLDATYARVSAVLRPFRGAHFMVFHPAYGYFADAFGLEQLVVEVEGKEPSARQLTRIIAEARRRRVKVIFVQPQFSRRTAEAIASAVGAAVVPLDPLAADYLANLDDMAGKLAKALGPRGEEPAPASGE
jgi:zinc transport system substrate-binding protein